MRRRTLVLLLLAAPALASVAPPAVPPEVLANLGDARLQGAGRLRVFGFEVYSARLFSGAQRVVADGPPVPLALEIDYQRSFDGPSIAERTLAEMRRQASLPDATGQRWLATLKALFPDVHAGDRLVGVQRPGDGVLFYFNGRLLGQVDDADFGRRFFDIWLSGRSSEPALRDALLGSGT